MMKLLSMLYPVRWFLLIAAGLIGMMSYADLSGLRLLTFGNQQQWSASGPGGHK
jgi:hypothetical protein